MESQTGADDNPFELSHVPASSSASSFSLSESGTSSTLAAYSAPDTQPDATSQEYTQQRQDGGGTSDSSPLCSKFLSSFTSSNLFLFALCHVFTCTGLVVSILGPVLNLLAYQTSSSFENIVWIFTMRSIGFFLGGLIGPAVLEKDWAKQHPRLTLLVPVSLEFLSTILIPSVSSLWILFILLLVQGTSIGSAENMCKLLLVRLFKEKAAPYMNLLFGCFGVGGIVAPLIVSAFLPSTSAAATSTAITDASQYSTSYRGAFFVVAAILAPNILILSATALQEEISWAQIKNALLGRASAPSAGSVASSIESSMMADEASQTSPQNPQQQADNTVVADSKGGGSVLQALRALPPIQIFMALNVTGVIFMYLGVELWGSFLATLGQNCYGMNPADASLLSSAFWLSFTTGRMLGVPLSSKFKPMQLLTTDMCGMVFSLLLMLIAPSSIGMLCKCGKTQLNCVCPLPGVQASLPCCSCTKLKNLCLCVCMCTYVFGAVGLCFSCVSPRVWFHGLRYVHRVHLRFEFELVCRLLSPHWSSDRSHHSGRFSGGSGVTIDCWSDVSELSDDFNDNRFF